MPNNRYLSFILLIFTLSIFSCENDVESESISYNCYGNLATPEISLIGTNDFPFTDGGLNGSTYYFTIEFDSECMLDKHSNLQLTLELYNDDILNNTYLINYKQDNLNENGNRINGGVGIRFGSSNKAKLIFKMTNLLGNEVSLEIDKHDGAN